MTTTTTNTIAGTALPEAGRGQDDNNLSLITKLAKDLAAVVNGSNADADTLEAAKAAHASSADTSIRALSGIVSAINAPLNKKELKATVELMAKDIIGIADSTKRARKSEILKVLEQRQHVASAIHHVDEANKSRGDDEQLNVRQATLSALTRIKSNKPEHADIIDAKGAVDSVVADRDYVPDDVEKATDLIDKIEKLGGGELFNVKNDNGEARSHPAMAAIRAAILATVGGDNQAALDSLEDGSEGFAEPVTPEPEVERIEDIQFELEEHTPVEPEPDYDNPPIEIPDNVGVIEDEDIFDLDSSIAGLL